MALASAPLLEKSQVDPQKSVGLCLARVPRGDLSADLSAVFTNQLISADEHQHPADDPTLPRRYTLDQLGKEWRWPQRAQDAP